MDSEHSAIFQAMAGSPAAIERVVLTGSGGPFRGRTPRNSKGNGRRGPRSSDLADGPEITVDLAT